MRRKSNECESVRDDGLSPREKRDRIDILLTYYDTLRWDIHVRTGGIYTLVAALMVVLTLIPPALSSPRLLQISAVAFGIVLLVFAQLFYRINRDISKAAERLRELEAQINELAGAQLLDWESRYGGMVAGFIGKGRPLPKEKARD